MDYLVVVLLPQLLHGLVFGAALGLLALGLTVIFGLLGVMNFAHGELYMLGAYAGIAVIGVTQSFWVALIVAPVLVGVLAVITEVADAPSALPPRAALRAHPHVRARARVPRGRPPDLGRRHAADPAALHRLDAAARHDVPELPAVPARDLDGAALAIWLFFTRTRAGIVVRAAVQDAEMLDGLGVNVARVFTLTFAGSAALAALAGCCWRPCSPSTRRWASR